MSRISRVGVVAAVVVAGGAIAFFASRKHLPAPVPQAPASQTQTSPADEVQKETITDNGKGYTISVQYPRTQSATVSKYLSDFALKQIDEFKSDTSWLTDPTLPPTSETASLETTYTMASTAAVTTYIFSTTSYTGGAHDLTTTTTFNFDRVSGELLTLKNIFTDETKGIAALSTYTIQELKKRKISDDKWIQDGAGPTEDNYQDIAFTSTGIEVFFDPYDVAAYASGPQTVTVPYAVVKSVLLPAFNQ